MNERGEYFPVWGTCLGFELLTYLAADDSEHRAHCSSTNQALPLVFKEDYKSSRLFNKAPETVLKILQSEAVTANFHQYCVTEKVEITNIYNFLWLPSMLTIFTELLELNRLQPR